MVFEEWKQTIIEQMEALGVSQDGFLPVVESAARTLELRDQAMEEFRASGEGTVVRHTSDRGAVNTRKNPLIQVIIDLNKSALSFWGEMGLTPAALKRITEKKVEQPKEPSPLERLIYELEHKSDAEEPEESE